MKSVRNVLVKSFREFSNYQPNAKDTDEMLKYRTQQEIQTIYIIRPVNSLNKRLAKIDIMASSNTINSEKGGLISNIATLQYLNPVSKKKKKTVRHIKK